MDNLADNNGTGKAPFMRLWVNDFMGGVSHMTAAQRGAHISMLCYAWERGGCPSNLRRLKQITGEIEEDDLLLVLEQWTLQGGQYIHERQERERSDVRILHEKGVHAAKKRWSHAKPMPDPMPNACQSDAKPMPDPMPNACMDDATQSPRVSESQSPRDTDAQSAEAQSPEAQKEGGSRRRRKRDEPTCAPISFDYATGKFSGITDEIIAEWTESYPAVDVKGTILRQAQWLLASQERKKNYRLFITGWLNRDQKESGDRSPTGSIINSVPEHLQF